MDRLTRKELKQDKFAQEVSQTVEFFGEHRQQIVRYGVVALAIVLVAAGWFYYSKRQQAARQRELAAAMDLMNAPVGPSALYGPNSFPTVEEKNKAVAKAFSDLASMHSRSEEGRIARYFLGTAAASQGRPEEAIKHLTEASTGNSPYAPLAALALAEVYGSQGKVADAEKLLRGLMDKPGILVSKEQATLALARVLMHSRPEEARKLLEPLRASPGAVGRAAVTALEAMEALATQSGA